MAVINKIYTDKDGVVHEEEHGEPDGWYCRCGGYHSYYVTQCGICKEVRKR